MKTIHVKHHLWNRLCGGHGQNKIGDAHLHHVGGIALHMHDNMLKGHSFVGAAQK